MSDKPIHLPLTSTGAEPSVTCPMWITQSALDGIALLLSYAAGVEAAGRGQIPGAFELTMHYRQLRTAIHAHYEKDAKA